MMSDVDEGRRTGNLPAALAGMPEDALRGAIEDALHRLSVESLTAIIESAQERRREKEDEVKEALLREFREKAAGYGLRVRLEPMDAPTDGGGGRRTRRDAGQPLPVKYRGPNGEEWSGRGVSPKWLRQLEEDGHNREEYRVA